MALTVVRGQKTDLTKSNPGLGEVVLELGWGASAADLDLDGAAFMLQQSGKCGEDQDFIFYGNPKGRGGAVEVLETGQTKQTRIKVQFSLIPADVEKVAVTLTIYDDGQKKYQFGQVASAYLRIFDREQNGRELVYFDLSGLFAKETAIVVAELYRHQGEWKLNPIGMGYEGGLAALCGSFGIEASNPPPSPSPNTPPPKVETPPPPPPPTPPSPPAAVNSHQLNPVKETPQPSSPEASLGRVNLSKIELKKAGEKINLTKGSGSQQGEIGVNLNWNQSTGKQKVGVLGSLFGSSGGGAIDLDLGCFVEMKNGDKAVVQALGNSFGSYSIFPYVVLDGDDRTGTVATGENLRINGGHMAEFKRILIYAFIYEGVANWAKADGVVTLKQPGGPDIEVRLDQHDPNKKMCAIAVIQNSPDGNTSIERIVRYFSGHRDMDQAFGWGFRWQAGRK